MNNRAALTTTLADIRRDAGVTQEQLATAVGVTRQTIISIERGNYVPSVLLALRIAAHFKLPVEAVFTIY
jgi:putative transcriptional regulator